MDIKNTKHLLSMRLLRVIRGMSQAEIGQLVGVTQGYVSRIERGRRSGSSRVRHEIARALGVEESTIFPAPLRLARGGG